MAQANATAPANKKRARDVPDRIGKYVIINEVGQGSTFWIELPLHGATV